MVVRSSPRMTSQQDFNELVRVLEETRNQVAQLQLQQAVWKPVAGTASSSGDRVTKLVSIVDANIVNKIGVFTGDDEDWKQWCFIFESTAGLIDLDSVLAVSEEVLDEQVLGFTLQTDEIKLRMKALYQLLVSTTRGRALTIMQMVPKGNGAIGWRRLKAEYEPRSAGRLTAMLMGILKPEWDEAAHRGPDAWEAVWKEWEKNVTLYETQAGETISPGTKIATVTRWAPSDVKAVIRQGLGAIGTDYNRLAQLVRDFIASGKLYEKNGNREGANPHGRGRDCRQGQRQVKGEAD